MITLSDIRAQLTDRATHKEVWKHAPEVVDIIEAHGRENPDYAWTVTAWLACPSASTIHLRDKVMEPLRNHPRLIEIGRQFNPTTEWDNTWMPLDTAMHWCRQGYGPYDDLGEPAPETPTVQSIAAHMSLNQAAFSAALLALTNYGCDIPKADDPIILHMNNAIKTDNLTLTLAVGIVHGRSPQAQALGTAYMDEADAWYGRCLEQSWDYMQRVFPAHAALYTHKGEKS